jgi:hypothetical protein
MQGCCLGMGLIDQSDPRLVIVAPKGSVEEGLEGQW